MEIIVRIDTWIFMFKVKISLYALFKILIENNFKVQSNYRDMEGRQYLLLMQVGNSDNVLFYDMSTLEIMHVKGIFFNQLVHELNENQI